MKCPKCGADNPAAANFCSQCGASIGATGSGSRRPVAVIFADLSGFTALSERIDPEELKDLVDRVLQRLAGVIHNYEGYVDKFIGDCVMALFGAPTAHEDDPLRAVLASLDMLAEIERFNQESGHRLGLAIGINYGMVATGDLGKAGAYTVMGDVVNLAQRLQAAAPPGRVYVSAAVADHTRAEIEYQRKGRIRVKGRTAPVEVMIPRSVRRRYSLRKIREIPLVGREEELTQLQRCLRAAHRGKGTVVSVIGEAGIGKSKLIYEFRRIVTGPVRVLEAKGIEYLQSSPYRVLKEIIRQVFSIPEDEPPERAGARVESFLKELDDVAIMVRLPYYRFFLSCGMSKLDASRFDSMRPEDRVRMVNEALSSLLLRLARTRPLIVILDDCHWIDRETMEFFRNLGAAIARRPVMLICLYRPVLKFTLPSGARHQLTLRIRPLSGTDLQALIRQLLNCRTIDPNLLRMLIGKSGALPFYVHELTTALARGNAIVVEHGSARLKEGTTFAIPRSLDELVMTTIDRLAPPLRRLVNAAAVIGDNFSTRVLRSIVTDTSFDAELGALEELDLVAPCAPQAEGESEDPRFMFKHSIIRDAVYSSLLNRERRQLHRQVGYVMEEKYANRLAEQYDTLAYHFELAGETAKAAHYFENAGDRKRDLYQNAEAIRIYEKCLTLTSPSAGAARARLEGKLGAIHELTGDYERARGAYANMTRHAGNDPLITAQSLSAQAGILRLRGNYDEALLLLDRARMVLKDAGSRDPAAVGERANIGSLECWLYRIKGQTEEAEARGQEAISAITSLRQWHADAQLKRILARAYARLAIVRIVKGDYEKAAALCEDALLISDELGDQRAKGDILNTLGTIHRNQGNYEEAITAFEQKRAISEELGDKNGIAIAYSNLGNVYQNKGDLDRALELFQKHLALSKELGSEAGIGLAANNLGIVYFNLGKMSEAIAAFKEYQHISANLGDRRGVAVALGNLGEVYANQRAYSKAIRCFKEYLARSRQLGFKSGVGSAAYNLATVYLETGRQSEANALLDTARQIFTELGNRSALADVESTAARLRDMPRQARGRRAKRPG